MTVDGTLQSIGLVAFAGDVVTAQERFTTPAKPPEGDAEIVEVFPVAAPALMAIAPAFSVNVACDSVIVPVPVDPM